MISVEGVSKRYGPVVAVDQLSFLVERGEVVGFLGPNGAGKTTTLRILATLLPPTAGVARVAGFDVARQQNDVRRQIGYVAQAGGSYRESTGREELVIQGRLFGMSKADARRRAQEVLEALDLVEAADRTCKTYSGGMRRRLNIGIGMVHRPAILFLDEPTTGLDPQARAHLWDEIRKLRDSGTSVFLTTHYLEEADALCDRLAIIDRGRIVAEGSPESLRERWQGALGIVVELAETTPGAHEALAALPGVDTVDTEDEASKRFTLACQKGADPRAEIFRMAVERGWTLVELSPTRASLEDIFVRLTTRDTEAEARAAVAA
jgi:ABC-2 type transport system ATP-binding protein